jgi:hypothetical protein
MDEQLTASEIEVAEQRYREEQRAQRKLEDAERNKRLPWPALEVMRQARLEDKEHAKLTDLLST